MPPDEPPAVAVAVAEPAEAEPEAAPPMAEAAAAHAIAADAAATHAAEAAVATAALAEAGAARTIADFEEELGQCRAENAALGLRLDAESASRADQLAALESGLRGQLSSILERLERPAEPSLTNPPPSPSEPESHPAPNPAAPSEPEPPRRKAHRWI